MKLHTISTEISLIVIICMLFVLLIQLITPPASPQDFCNPCDYPLQPGEVMRVTTLTAPTPELLDSEVEAFVGGLAKVVKVDRSQFPEKVIVWHVDYVELDESHNPF